MKKIKWKNIIIAMIFITSLGLILSDAVKMIIGYSYTTFGCITGLIAFVLCISSYEYLEAEMEN